jgi:hypothetical protein
VRSAPAQPRTRRVTATVFISRPGLRR